jgi:hypothetical protein
MKTFVTMIASLLSATCLVMSGFGQSTFGFQNWIAGGLDAPVFDSAGNRLAGTDYVAMLYGGPTVDMLVPARNDGTINAMSPVPFTYQPLGMSGYFREPLYVTVANVLPGATAWLQVRAWDTRLGATYEDVVALGIGGYGESNLFQKRGGDPEGGVPGLPEPLIGLQSFSLLPVIPEPSSTALLLLGLSLLLRQCRRDKM